jgi:hypothetical protein
MIKWVLIFMDNLKKIIGHTVSFKLFQSRLKI